MKHDLVTGVEATPLPTGFKTGTFTPILLYFEAVFGHFRPILGAFYDTFKSPFRTK